MINKMNQLQECKEEYLDMLKDIDYLLDGYKAILNGTISKDLEERTLRAQSDALESSQNVKETLACIDRLLQE